MSSLDRHLTAATAIPVSPALIGPEALDAIHSVAALLPGSLSTFFGFECPLLSPEPRADFLVHVDADGRGTLAALAASYPDSPAWPQIAAFVGSWSDASHPLHSFVQNMWLEFDIAGRVDRLPVPSVFFGVPPSGLRASATSGWLAEALTTLRPGLEPATLRNVVRCVSCLPEESWIFQVGLMLSRPSQVVRLCLRGAGPADWEQFLRQIGWQGPLAELRSLMDRLAAHSARIDLDIDVADSIRPKMGIECYTEAKVAERGRLIGLLEAAGLCHPEKAAALRHPTVFTHQRIHRPVWPEELLQTAELLGGRTDSVFWRSLYHVKAVFEEGRPLDAKAYLAVQQDWMEPSVLMELVRGHRSAEGMEPRRC